MLKFPGSGAKPSTVMIAEPLGLHREDQAGAHRPPVEQHRAGAAHAMLATGMRAGQVSTSRRKSTSVMRAATSTLQRAVDGELNAHRTLFGSARLRLALRLGDGAAANTAARRR